MKRWTLSAGAALLIGATPALANDSVLELQKDPNQWVMQLGDYASTRYSQLDQINKDGTTVLMATHDSTIVDQMRRRVIELSDGRLVRDQAQGVYGYQ